MFEAIVEENAIHIRISSEMPLVNEAVRACTRFAGTLSMGEPIALSLLLRELLVNAVKHGNRCAAERVVTVDITREPDELLCVRVTDEGQGFNYLGLNLGLPTDPSRVHRHGYMLIAALSERLDFNASGNGVTAWTKPPDRAEALRPTVEYVDPDAAEIADRVFRLIRKDDGRQGRLHPSFPDARLSP